MSTLIFHSPGIDSHKKIARNCANRRRLDHFDPAGVWLPSYSSEEGRLAVFSGL